MLPIPTVQYNSVTQFETCLQKFRGFINVFSRGASGFQRHEAKLFGTITSVKSSLQLINLPSDWSLLLIMKPQQLTFIMKKKDTEESTLVNFEINQLGNYLKT